VVSSAGSKATGSVGRPIVNVPPFFWAMAGLQIMIAIARIRMKIKKVFFINESSFLTIRIYPSVVMPH
jgi:hypothetical protein